jgi:hypothetical protein
MLRRRTIAASPVRSASATWQVITDLVADTVAVSASCDRSEAENAMIAAAPVGRMLVAGGHLDRLPVVLVAGAVHCEITTVSGTPALRTEENHNAIPGATTASSFTIFLPSPSPLKPLIAGAVAGHDRLSDASPPVPPAQASTASRGGLIDTDTLRKAVTGR